MNFCRGHIPIAEPSAGSKGSGEVPDQVMLVKNSISLESGVSVTMAFLLLAV